MAAMKPRQKLDPLDKAILKIRSSQEKRKAAAEKREAAIEAKKTAIPKAKARSYAKSHANKLLPMSQVYLAGWNAHVQWLQHRLRMAIRKKRRTALRLTTLTQGEASLLKARAQYHPKSVQYKKLTKLTGYEKNFKGLVEKGLTSDMGIVFGKRLADGETATLQDHLDRQAGVASGLRWHDVGCIKRYGAGSGTMCGCEKRAAERRGEIQP